MLKIVRVQNGTIYLERLPIIRNPKIQILGSKSEFSNRKHPSQRKARSYFRVRVARAARFFFRQSTNQILKIVTVHSLCNLGRPIEEIEHGTELVYFTIA